MLKVKARVWSLLCFLCVPAVFPVWRGVGTSSGVGGRWSQGWGRCLRWEPQSPGQAAQISVLDCPVWLVLCRQGRARLREVCQRGRVTIRLPSDMLSIKLPQLFDIHQVPKVSKERHLHCKVYILYWNPCYCYQTVLSKVSIFWITHWMCQSGNTDILLILKRDLQAHTCENLNYRYV